MTANENPKDDTTKITERLEKLFRPERIIYRILFVISLLVVVVTFGYLLFLLFAKSDFTSHSEVLSLLFGSVGVLTYVIGRILQFRKTTLKIKSAIEQIETVNVKSEEFQETVNSIIKRIND